MADQLGKINFDVLSNYIWKAGNFKLFGEYLNKDLLASIQSRHGFGIIEGCKVSHVAGMTLAISEGLILFSNGVLVSYPGEEFNITASDPDDIRYDRVSLKFKLENNTTVQNTANVDVVLDILHKAEPSVAVGVPGGAEPAKVPGEVSLAMITVGNGVAALNSSNIDQSQFHRGISQDKKKHQREFTILNNQAADADLGDLRFDPALIKGFVFEYFITRKDEAQHKSKSGKFTAAYDDVAAEWYGEGEAALEAGVTLGITTLGQLVYRSTNFSVTAYEGELIVTNVTYIYR